MIARRNRVEAILAKQAAPIFGDPELPIVTVQEQPVEPTKDPEHFDQAA
jgi:hypothetical protein